VPPFPASLYRLYAHWSALCNRVWPWVRADGMQLRVAPSVYKPIQNEARVAALVPDGLRVLDVGCGSGVMGLAVAGQSRRVLAIDVNPAAVRCTRENAKRLGHANIEVRVADVRAMVGGASFGAILCSPPFGETDVPGAQQNWASAAGVLEALFAGAPRWLAPDGRLIVHHLASARARLERLGAARGLALRAVVPNHRKSARLHALAWLYLQMGLRTAFYVFERG